MFQTEIEGYDWEKKKKRIRSVKSCKFSTGDLDPYQVPVSRFVFINFWQIFLIIFGKYFLLITHKK